MQGFAINFLLFCWWRSRSKLKRKVMDQMTVNIYLFVSTIIIYKLIFWRMLSDSYTLDMTWYNSNKNAQVAAARLLPSSHQAYIRASFAPLASAWWQAWCKLTVMLHKLDESCFRLDSSWWANAWCNWIVNLHQAGKIYNLHLSGCVVSRRKEFSGILALLTFQTGPLHQNIVHGKEG